MVDLPAIRLEAQRDVLPRQVLLVFQPQQEGFFLAELGLGRVGRCSFPALREGVGDVVVVSGTFPGTGRLRVERRFPGGGHRVWLAGGPGMDLRDAEAAEIRTRRPRGEARRRVQGRVFGGFLLDAERVGGEEDVFHVVAERAGAASRLRRTGRVVRYGRREDLRRLRCHERAAVVDVVEEGLF